MHCSHCGNSVAPGSRFCPHCGTPIAPAYTVRPALTRPRTGRMIAGVCAAFARTYGWNLTLTRVLLVVLTPFHLGIGFLAYLIAWIVIPEEHYVLAPGIPVTPPSPPPSAQP